MKVNICQLESLEQQIDNLDIEISRLMSLRENESDDWDLNTRMNDSLL